MSAGANELRSAWTPKGRLGAAHFFRDWGAMSSMCMAQLPYRNR